MRAFLYVVGTGLAAAALFASGMLADYFGVGANEWFTFVTMLATVAAAVAAIRAVRSWRAQQIGQTEHDLAKRMAMHVYKLGRLRSDLAHDLMLLDRGAHPATVEMVAQRFRDRHDAEATEICSRMDELEFEANIVWGPSVSGIVNALNNGTRGLLEHVRARATEDMFALLGCCEPNGLPYSSTTFTMRMAGMTDVLQKWLLAHVGRADVKPMSLAAFERMIDEVQRAADKAVAKELAATERERLEAEEQYYRENANALAEHWEHEQRFDAVDLPTSELS